MKDSFVILETNFGDELGSFSAALCCAYVFLLFIIILVASLLRKSLECFSSVEIKVSNLIPKRKMGRGRRLSDRCTFPV